MATADPTLDFLRRLEDSSQWVIVKAVPIFKEHERKGRDGKVLYQVGPADLDKIVQRYKRLEAEYGVIPRITIGHIHLHPEASEASQPEVVGYARNLRVGTFGPGKTKAVLADHYYRKDAWERARKFPYRSAEYYPSNHEISGVALLVRDPQLDLGMVAYERDHPRFSYAMENSQMDPTQAPAPDGLSPEETQLCEKLMRYMSSKFPGLQQLMAPPAPAPVAAPAPAPAPAAPAFPSATNGGPPAPKEEKDGPPEQSGRAVDPVQYQRLESDFRALQQQYVRAECQRELERLSEEGFQLDIGQEVSVMVPLTAQQRSERLGYIRRYYRQAPVGRGFLPVPVFAGERSGGSAPALPDEATSDKVIHYMKVHNVEWDVAEAAVKAGK